MTGSCGAPATGLPRFSLAADGSCRSPPSPASSHSVSSVQRRSVRILPKRGCRRQQLPNGGPMGYGQPRSQARISPSPHPRPHSSATSVALPRCASARGTPPGTDATACTDMGTPEILRYAVWSAHCFLEDFSTGTLWIILRSAHRRTGVPAWTSGRRQRSGCHERPLCVATRALYSYYTRYLFPSPTAGRTRAPL